jgi:signal transduction histidine kinase
MANRSHEAISEETLRASHRFLVIANKHNQMRPLLDEFVSEIKANTGCDAVGIRILDKNGKIPYQSYAGFGRRFFEKENLLCTKSHDCMCVNVIRGTTDPKTSCYSNGSFFLNNTTTFLKSLSPDKRLKTRGVCNEYGYESLALVPIRMGRRILGLIHVADSLPDKVPPRLVKSLESIAMQLGAAIQRIKAEEKLRKAYDKLEARVKKRTHELTQINEQLRMEIEDRKKTEAALKLNESRLATLYQLGQMEKSSLQEICDFAVEQGVQLTQSEYGYLFFMNEDETVLTVHAWSIEAMAICAVPDLPKVYMVKDTGLWGEAVRQRQPIITNEYTSSEYRRGLPTGHVLIRRHMNIPVFEGSRIVAVAGVANKVTDYVDTDVRQLDLLMRGMWRHIQRKRAQEALLASEEKLRFLTTQLLTAQEKERKRISNELHDELGQALLTLKLQLRALQRQLRDDQDSLKCEFEYLFKHINIVTDNVRRLSKELSPSILEDLGLVAALSWLVKEIGKHHYINITCDIDLLEGLFDGENELLLFRIFQEALTNVAKHARTRFASITTEYNAEGDYLKIVIADKGRGFDVEQATAVDVKERGLGLSAMYERVRILGGTIDIRSGAGEGTQIIIRVPVPSVGIQA